MNSPKLNRAIARKFLSIQRWKHFIKKESPTTQIIDNQTKSQKPQELQIKQEKKRANDLEL